MNFYALDWKFLRIKQKLYISHERFYIFLKRKCVFYNVGYLICKRKKIEINEQEILFVKKNFLKNFVCKDKQLFENLANFLDSSDVFRADFSCL